MSSRFVRPETTRLTLDDGDWLEVKRRLTAGEQRAAFARMYVAGVDGTFKTNPLQIGPALITAYLIDWSFTDDSGAVYPIRGLSADDLATVLDSLDPESFGEIREAVERHDGAMAAERAQEKKLRSGVSTTETTSPSPSAPAGALIGSVN